MYKAIAHNIKVSYAMIKENFSAIMVFELLYKLIASFILIPLSVWLLSITAENTNLKILTNQNYVKAVLNPEIIAVLLLLMIVFSAFTMFEISYLTLGFNQCYQGKHINISKMIILAFTDSFELLKKKNLPGIPFLVLMIPLANSAIISSIITGFSIPKYILSKIASKPLLLTMAIFVIVLTVIIVIGYSTIFEIYCLENETMIDATKIYFKRVKGRFFKRVITIIVTTLVFAAVIFFFYELIYLVLRLFTKLFAEYEGVYAFLLAANMLVKRAMNFIIPSMIVVCAYASISALYFHNAEMNFLPPPVVHEPRNPKSKKNNKKVFWVLSAVIVVYITGATFLDAKSSLAGFNSGDIIIMAHRGASKDCPENTMPAFEKAVELQADYIELDVQESKDGAIVVTHDSNFKRCTGYSGYVWNMTLEEIKQLDAGYRFEEYRNTKVPTLEEVIEEFKGKIKFNIEIKTNKHTKNLVKNVADVIFRYDLEDDVVISSSSTAVLKEMKSYLPDIKCGYIFSAAIGRFYKYSYADFFSIESSYVSENVLNEVHRLGKEVDAWTVNRSSEMKRMIASGTNAIITDDPLLAREVIVEAEDPLSILSFLLNRY